MSALLRCRVSRLCPYRNITCAPAAFLGRDELRTFRAYSIRYGRSRLNTAPCIPLLTVLAAVCDFYATIWLVARKPLITARWGLLLRIICDFVLAVYHFRHELVENSVPSPVQIFRLVA